MPELPEVETVRRGLEPILRGETIARVEIRRSGLRRPFPKGFASRLRGRRIDELRRRAKYLVAVLDDGNCLIMHLGMSGSFRVAQASDVGEVAHDHVLLHLGSGVQVIYNDPRRFGSMDIVRSETIAIEPPLAGLGIEPLGPELSAGFLAERLAGSRTPIKSALLDQRIVAGLGNIYACEALWRSRISPLRTAGSLANRRDQPSAACKRLPPAITGVLEAAIAAGGSSLRNHIQTDGSLGRFRHRFDVYDREGHPCQRAGCRGTVRRIVQAGRATFFCRACQR